MSQPTCQILLILALVAVLTGALNACGQKGHLYLPDRQHNQKSQ